MAYEHTTLVVGDFSTGLVSAVAPNHIPEGAAAVANNVRFRIGELQKIWGWITVGVADPSEFPITILIDADPQVVDGPVRLVIVFQAFTEQYENLLGTTKSIWYQSPSSGTYEPLTCALPIVPPAATVTYSVPDDAQWSACFGLGKMYLSDYADPILVYTGSGATPTVLSADAPLARVIRFFYSHLMAMDVIFSDTTVQRQCIQWSDINDPTDWVSTESNEAGFLPLIEGPDAVMTGEVLGNYFAVYKEYSIHLLTYQGYPYVFSRQQIVFNEGPVGWYAVANLYTYHVFLGHENFYKFDGTQITPIGDNIRDQFFALASHECLPRTYTVVDRKREEVLWVFCSTSSAGIHDQCVFMNYRTNAWGFRTFPFTSAGPFVGTVAIDDVWDDDQNNWDSDTTVWDDTSQTDLNFNYLLGGDSNGAISLLEVNPDVNDQAFVGVYTSRLYDYGSLDNIKHVNRFRLGFRQRTGSLQVEVGYTNDPNNPVTWLAPIILLPTQNRVDFRMAARYFQYRISNVDAGSDFRVFEYAPSIRGMEEER